jgi:hypothetical protein
LRDGVGFLYTDHESHIWLITALHVPFDLERADEGNLNHWGTRIWFPRETRTVYWYSCDVTEGRARFFDNEWSDCVAYTVHQLRSELDELKSRVEVLEREVAEVQEENRRLRELLPRSLGISGEVATSGDVSDMDVEDE